MLRYEQLRVYGVAALGCRRPKSRDKRLSGSSEGHGERDLGMSLGERRHSEGRRRREDTERTQTTLNTTDMTFKTTQLYGNESRANGRVFKHTVTNNRHFHKQRVITM